ncbi:PIG-L deacetylase family protein, partial [bacterium]
EKILVFEPHPDDVAFQIAGSVRKWLNQGKEVAICTVTTGNNSTFDKNISQDDIAAIMSREHRRALELLGINDEHYIQWDYDDLGIDPGLDRQKLLADMIKLIRTFRPTTVVTMDPKNILNEENPDHKMVATTGFEAAALSQHPHLFPEQYKEDNVEQHYVSRILFYTTPEPDTFIDISGEPFEIKSKMALAYESQFELLMTEARERLAGIGVELEIFNMPPKSIWPQMCRSMAEAAAVQCRDMFPERKNVDLAEAFRLQYPGVVHKLKSLLPDVLDYRDE